MKAPGKHYEKYVNNTFVNIFFGQQTLLAKHTAPNVSTIIADVATCTTLVAIASVGVGAFLKLMTFDFV
jgi:hypothetical protein